MSRQGRPGRAWVWVILGGIVVLGVLGVIAWRLLAPNAEPTPSPTTGSASPGTTVTSPPPDGDVDSTVTANGWVPEPITTDAETYASAALLAGGTFDTTLASRDEFADYLGTWFTPDTRYADDGDRERRMDAAKLELSQSVLLPDAEWDSLAEQSGKAVASLARPLRSQPVEGAPDQSIWTGTVTLDFTVAAPSGEETSYSEQAHVSVQVMCGPDTAPVPGTSQRPGDCKVVRFFSEAIEG